MKSTFRNKNKNKKQVHPRFFSLPNPFEHWVIFIQPLAFVFTASSAQSHCYCLSSGPHNCPLASLAISILLITLPWPSHFLTGKSKLFGKASKSSLMLPCLLHQQNLFAELHLTPVSTYPVFCDFHNISIVASIWTLLPVIPLPGKLASFSPVNTFLCCPSIFMILPPHLNHSFYYVPTMLWTDDYGNVIITLLRSTLKCLYFFILPGGKGRGRKYIIFTVLCLAERALRTFCGEKEGNEYTDPSLENKQTNKHKTLAYSLREKDNAG